MSTKRSLRGNDIDVGVHGVASFLGHIGSQSGGSGDGDYSERTSRSLRENRKVRIKNGKEGTSEREE